MYGLDAIWFEVDVLKKNCIHEFVTTWSRVKKQMIVYTFFFNMIYKSYNI